MHVQMLYYLFYMGRLRLFIILQKHNSIIICFSTGMVFRDFKGFHKLQEVVCFGDNMDANLRLASLQLVKFPKSSKQMIAVLRIDTKTCLTFNDYSSCHINLESPEKSRLSVLVGDLKEGESREYGCVANTADAFGSPVLKSWDIVVSVRSKSVSIAIL